MAKKEMFRLLEPVLYNKETLPMGARCDFDLLTEDERNSLIERGVIQSEKEYQEQRAQIDNADEQAADIVGDAKKEADQIIADAKKQAAGIADGAKNPPSEKGGAKEKGVN